MELRVDKRWQYFQCKRCGVCCTGIDLPYDPKSILEIAEYLDRTVPDTINKFYGCLTEDGKSIEFQSEKRNPCPFLDYNYLNQVTCKIYPARPYGCRGFPFDTPGTLDCPEACTVIDRIRDEET